MNISAHQLPQPHDAVTGSLDSDLTNPGDDLEPDYEAEETNAKVVYEGLHASSNTSEKEND